MRFDRVQLILGAEPAFKDKLGPKDQEVTKRNGDVVRYSKGVVDVTTRLHEKGIDAHSAPRPVVLAVATDVLMFPKASPKKTAEPKPRAKAKTPKPKPEVKVEAEPKKVEPKKVEPKKVEPKKVEPKKVEPKPRKTKPTEPAAPAAPASPAPVAPSPTPEPAPAVVQAKPDEMPTIAPFLSVLSLLLAAYNLLKLFDREPAAEKRVDRLNELIDEMNSLRDVTVPIPINTLPPSLTDGHALQSKPKS
jgi:hypothetical protein